MGWIEINDVDMRFARLFRACDYLQGNVIWCRRAVRSLTNCVKLLKIWCWLELTVTLCVTSHKYWPDASVNAQKRENIFSKFKAQDETEVKHNTAQKKKSQRNINKRDTYTGEICCRAEEKKIEYALWIDTEIADDNLTSSHDNLFSQHFLTFIVSLYLCLYLFCSAICYAVLLLGLFFCSHRDLLITVFCAGKLMFVQKAWTWEKRRERETVKKKRANFLSNISQE